MIIIIIINNQHKEIKKKLKYLKKNYLEEIKPL